MHSPGLTGGGGDKLLKVVLGKELSTALIGRQRKERWLAAFLPA